MENLTSETQNAFKFVQNESAEVIKEYLQNVQSQHLGQDRVKRLLNQRDRKNQTVLHIACLKHHLDKTRVFLEAGANPNVRNDDKQTPAFLVVIGLQNCSCEECTKKAVRCLTLLSYYGGIVGIPDAKGRTPLYLCAVNRFVDCAKALILNGCNLGETPTGGPMIDVLVKKIPGVLETVFDCAVIPKGHLSIDDPKFKVAFDLGVVVPYKSCATTGEMTFLRNLLRYSERDHDCNDPTTCILRHPLVSVFMDIKWKALQCWYLSSILYQFLALVAYTSVIGVTIFYDCPYEKYQMLRRNSIPRNFSTLYENNTETVDFTAASCKARTMNRIFGIIIIINAVFILGHEMHRAFFDFKEYVKNIYHYLSVLAELAVIFTMFVAITLDHTSSVYASFYPVSAFAISILWCQIFVLIGRIPKLAIYVEMLVTISANFLRTLAIYSFLLVGFSISFCILFQSNPQMHHFLLSMTKVLSMLVGELDHETLLNPSSNDDNTDDNNDGQSNNFVTSNKSSGILSPLVMARNELSMGHRTMAYVWYVGVVIMVTLVLMNLLVGLAVSDIQGIRLNAEIYVIKRRIRYVAYLEKLFLEVFGNWLWSKWNLMRIKEVICPVELRYFTINVYPNDKRFHDVCKDTKLGIKQWITSSSRGIHSNIVRKCKGTSNDSSNTLSRGIGRRQLRRRTRISSLVVGQHHQIFLGESPKQTTDTDRLRKLERTMEQLNDKLDFILEGVLESDK